MEETRAIGGLHWGKLLVSVKTSLHCCLNGGNCRRYVRGRFQRHRPDFANGNCDQIDFRKCSQQHRRFDQVLQANVVGHKGFWEISGKPRLDAGHGTWRLAVRCGIDEDDPFVIEEITQQLKAPGPAIYQIGPGSKSRRLQMLHGEHANPLIAHEHVAHAEDKDLGAGRLSRLNA
jgi:hypothetical protein